MKLQSILIREYMPYAKWIIIARAIPAIDGLKPVQRRALYAMYQLGLLNSDTKKKSNKVVGDTMGNYHPHSDAAIYEAIALMTDKYEKYNVPLVAGKGAFGKVYSRDLQCAKMRYTEVSLANICKEYFEGIKEDAVEMVENYDNTLKEPTLLPVKFPSILVNASEGVAVAKSSNIPTFELSRVCKATKGILEGTITNPKELSEVLGVPEFPTGGFVHASEASLEKLCATGKGSFAISGKVEVYANRIVINEIPFTTTAEEIIEAIELGVKEKRIKGIRDINDEIGLNEETGKEGFKLSVDIKSGYNSREVLAQLVRDTKLRDTISYRTNVIIDNRCMELGLLDLLNEWIRFRKNTIVRTYKHRLEEANKDEHELSTWEKIIKNIKEVTEIMVSNTEADAKDILKQRFGLDNIQVDYLFELKIKSITKDRAEASIKKLGKLREDIKQYTSIVEEDSVQSKMIINDMDYIIKTYAGKQKTIQANELTEEDKKGPVVKISDEVVTVVLTRDGYVRRLSSLRDISGKFVSKTGDPEVLRWNIRNNEHILVFDRFGNVNKVLVDNIDSSNKATMTDKLHELAGLEKAEDMIWADACGDYTGHFNLIYGNGKGIRVNYDRAIGKRKTYKGLYEEVKPRGYLITVSDRFFALTKKNKATYCNLELMNTVSRRTAFKVARLSEGDYFVRIVPENSVPNLGLIDISKYNKDYTVAMKDDVIWVDPKELERIQRDMEAKAVEMAKNAAEEAEAERQAEQAGDDEY